MGSIENNLQATFSSIPPVRFFSLWRLARLFSVDPTLQPGRCSMGAAPEGKRRRAPTSSQNAAPGYEIPARPRWPAMA